MSRTYRKYIAAKICVGNNRAYYKARRRKLKNLGRMGLRNMLANYDIDVVSNMWVEPMYHMKDDLDEPTDGHFGINRDIVKTKLKKYKWADDSYYAKEMNYYLKPKNRKHYRVV